MSNNEYVVATTYLKLLINEPELLSVLHSTFGSSYTELFDTEYVSGKDLQPIFNAFSNAGLESWVIKFGAQLGSATHGPLGFAILSAPNLKAALRVLTDYSSIRSTAYNSELIERDNRLLVTAVDQTHSNLVGRWLIEAGIRVTQRLVESIMAHPCGQHAAIQFAYSRPNYADKLDRYYAVKCQYDCAENSFSIPASWGQISSPLSDPGTYRSNLAKCQQLKQSRSQNLSTLETVQFRFDQFFNECYSGSCKPRELPNLESLASELALSPRTFARRLSEQNSSYKKVLEQARRKQAQDLLLNTHLNIADIAYYLAYQESANFIRAFKVWFKTTPTCWRKLSNKTNIYHD